MIQPLNIPTFSQQRTSFGAFTPSKKPDDYNLLQDFKRLKNIQNLSCACCGTEMNTEKDIQNYRYVIAHAADKPLIKALNDSMDFMNPTAKTVAKKIIVLAEQNEGADIKDLTKMLAKGRKLHFLEKQNKKLEIKLKKYVKPEILYKLPKEVITTLTTAYELAIRKKYDYEKTQQNTGLAFIRDNILQKLQFAITTHPELKFLLEAIRKDVQKLDSFYNSPDAFILFCEKMNSTQIAELFFTAKRASIEHIVPRLEGGTNDHGNLLIFCKECNVERDRSSYEDMPYDNIGFIGSLRKYLYTIKEHLDKGEYPGLENYPKQVTETLYKVSNGSIDIEA